MADEKSSLTDRLLDYADRITKSVSEGWDKTMGMPEEIAQQAYDYVISKGGSEDDAQRAADRLAAKAGRVTGLIDFLVPQSAADVALMAAGPLGPATKMGKAALGTGAALTVMEPTEAEASPLTKIFYRGVPRLRKQLDDQVSGLHVKERNDKNIWYSPDNTGGYAWASSNPDVANSYTQMGGTVIPLKAVKDPDFVMDAEGQLWNDFFYKDKVRNRGYRNPAYFSALEDPDVKSILIKNIIDPGTLMTDPLVKSLARARQSKPSNSNVNDLFIADNLLIKDPDVVRYLYTGETPKFAEGGEVKGYATGGGATSDDIRRMYNDYFGRTAGDDEVNYWTGSGLTLEDIGQQFANSDEAQQQYAQLRNVLAAPTATDASGQPAWKTYWGYTPNAKDYTQMLTAALGEVGVSPSYNQYRAIYEALGNRAAANTIAPDYGRGVNDLAGLITAQQIHGVKPESLARVNSYTRSKDPATIAAIETARQALNDYFAEGQNRLLGTQTDWRGFQNGMPSPGITLQGNPFLNRNVPDEGLVAKFNTFYDAEDRPDIAMKLAQLQAQRNAVYTPPVPPARPQGEELAALIRESETPDDIPEANPTIYQTFAQNPMDGNPFDTLNMQGATEQASTTQPDSTYSDEGFLSPNVVDPGTAYFQPTSTFNPNSFQTYIDPSINQAVEQQNQLNTSARDWQQNFDSLVNNASSFNMDNPANVGYYNPTNIGNFDYSGLSNSLGNIYDTPSFGINTGWDFGGNWGWAKGGKVEKKIGKVMGEYKSGELHSGSKDGPTVTNPKQAIAIALSEARNLKKASGGKVEFKPMFEGDSEQMQQRARELAREAYSGGLNNMGKQKAQEWETLARKYNLPLTVGPHTSYEDQYSEALSNWQRNVSPKQREQTFDDGGPVKMKWEDTPAYEFATPAVSMKGIDPTTKELLAMLAAQQRSTERDPAPVAETNDPASDDINRLISILSSGRKAPNVAPFSADVDGTKVEGRFVQAGPYLDIGGGVAVPMKDVMLMLGATYGKVPGTDMQPNISVRGGARIPFDKGGPVVMPSVDPMGFFTGMESLEAPEYPREALEARLDPATLEMISVQGVMIPNRAADIKQDDLGFYPVDAEGNRLQWVRRPGVLPLTTDEGSVRMAMPYILEMAGNTLGGVVSPVTGGVALGAGPIRRGEKTLADLVDTYGVKKPGGNWTKDVDVSIGSFYKSPEGTTSLDNSAYEAMMSDPVNKWVGTKLKNYVKNQMGTVADPLIDVAEVSGRLHLPSDQIINFADRLPEYRPFALNPNDKWTPTTGGGDSYNPNLIGETDLSRAWEKATQASIGRSLRKDWTNSYLEKKGLEELIEAPGDTQINVPRAIAYNRALGFDHLVDELRNATLPNSNLPDRLKIDPAKLEKYSMSQAVEHVAKINEWRDAQRAKAKIEASRNAATVPFKQYDVVPETNYPNERGLNWVQIKPTGNKDELEKALKYEGDTMGHCVGGGSYCPAVEAGRTEIYSLRDKKGEPHVTIEVRRVRNPKEDPNFDIYEHVPDEVREQALERASDLAIARIIEENKEQYMSDAYHVVKKRFPQLEEGSDEFYSKLEEAAGYVGRSKAVVNRNFDEYFEEEAFKIQMQEIEKLQDYDEEIVTINQIKGKGNAKPVDEYIPFVQDFIKSQNWYDVGEIKNADMFKVFPGQRLPGSVTQIPPGYYTFRDLEKIGAENGMTAPQISTWLKRIQQQQ